MSTKSSMFCEDKWRFGESLNYQSFGQPLDANDMLNSHINYHRWPRTFKTTHGPPLITKNGYSYVKNNSDVFQVMLDCEHFAPEEINVKIVDDELVVNAKHAEKSDEHGKISREFTRKYELPKDVDVTNVMCSFRPDGVLSINCPKQAYSKYSGKQRIIPIEMEETVNKNNSYYYRNGTVDSGTNP